ncbi:MAG: DUF5107 domain-containing protein [Terracidiphilus sp.]
MKAWREDVEILTYAPEQPDRNPMFLDRRVYQGSSGRVYPLPFIDRIAGDAVEHRWQAVHLENEFLRVMILPEIGGRIHVGYDKTNCYDFFYRQNVIKPALVGLAGPWISGGVEFNWPQHHRPATFMPVECTIERQGDGSVIVWCSDHDPMTRMKGMHGVCLHPGKAYIELKVRLFNRTPFVQTFLWWANVAARVHERYQSFFPPDVRYVADHAKRAVTAFPLSNRPYYGVDYAERARTGVPADEVPGQFVPDGSYPANDLSWYSNIPVPTSYMIAGSEGDFVGGYDHAAQAGFVHVASHHIAPGKKQWTWGNHDFGYAWDRNLTDADGPYVELMAGVYTDNQPDFSFLAPFETKSFSQFWYPIRRIGPPSAANLDAALSLRVDGNRAHIGVCPTRALRAARIVLSSEAKTLAEWTRDLAVAEPFLATAILPAGVSAHNLRATVECAGEEIVGYAPAQIHPSDPPTVATEPLLPEDIASADELYLTGLHLEQYRHATRDPEPYWREAVRRDPGDCRSNNALGLWHLRRGEFPKADSHFRSAISRLTHRNANPRDGEPYYNLGLTLQLQRRHDEAYSAFYKATWNAAWRAPAYFALAAADSRSGHWRSALDHVDRSLAAETENLNARNLKAMLLRKLDRDHEASNLLRETAALDPLDVWSRYLLFDAIPSDSQQLLDLAFDLAGSGFPAASIATLHTADLIRGDGTAPIILYFLGDLYAQIGDAGAASAAYDRAAIAKPDYCFPARLEELVLLEAALRRNPADARAAYYLGNLLYDRRRHDEAICFWERAAALDPGFPTVWRNLGIGYFNQRGDTGQARDAFDQAFAANPADARVLYERDQLWKKLGDTPERRLSELNRYPDLCRSRDDLTVEMATLLNQTGRPEDALQLLLSRTFQPWEGGEGLVLGQYVQSLASLGQRAIAHGDPQAARAFFVQAQHPPENLSEARYLLANQSDIWFWIGASWAVEGRQGEAAENWRRAARQRGDFQQMRVRPVSDMTFWSALALLCLGEKGEARELFQAILDHSLQLERETPAIDYFATSLPSMLLFATDLAELNRVASAFLRAQAYFGLGRRAEAEDLLREVLSLDRNHRMAAELLQQGDALAKIAGLEPAC